MSRDQAILQDKSDVTTRVVTSQITKKTDVTSDTDLRVRIDQLVA